MTPALQNHVRILVFAVRIQLLKVLSVSAERTIKDETVRPVSVTVHSENFAKSVKRHVCHFNSSRPGHDLPTSVNDRVMCKVSRK